MTRRRLAAIVITALASTTTASATIPPGAATAQASTCARAYCVEDELTIPARPPSEPTHAAPPAPVDDRPPADRPGPQCTWASDPGRWPGGDGGPGNFPEIGDRRSLDDYLIFERCDGELTGRVQWASPTEPPPPGGGPATPAPRPSAADLAATIRVRLEGDLPHPVAATSPPADEPSIVNHPTFLAIANWTDTVTDEECAFLLCVTVTATPTLTWSPGEPGTSTISCPGSGTRFDPAAGPPADQASRPGACAHAYQTRTGVADRPDAWPGTATVTWDLTWTSTTGTTGGLAPIARTADVPRPVDEVHAIVTE